VGVFLGPVGANDPLSAEVARLAIRPGDFLVLKFDRNLFPDEPDEIEAAVARVFRDADYKPKVLILEAGAEIGVIGPEEAGGEPAAPQALTLQFDGSSGDEFIRWLRETIRRRGGPGQVFA